MKVKWEKYKHGDGFHWRAEGKNWSASVKIPWNEETKYRWDFLVWGKNWEMTADGLLSHHKKARRDCEEFMNKVEPMLF